MLSRRCASKDTTMAALLGKVSDDQAITAGLALHSLAIAYTNPMLLSVVGSDGKGKKFETAQLAHAFATCRVPASKVDFLKASASSTYALVWYKSNAYMVHVLDSSFRPYSASTITEQIRYILLHEASGRDRNLICQYSSTLKRQDWAQIRQRLRETNLTAVELVEGALTSVALHETCPNNSSEKLSVIREDPSCVYADQTTGLSVFADGNLGIRFDHAAIDGGAACYLVGFLHYLINSSSSSSWPSVMKLSPTKIDFVGLGDFHCPTAAPDLPAQKSITFSVPLNKKLLGHLRSSKLVDIILQLTFQAAILSQKSDGSTIKVMEPVSTRHFSKGRCIPQLISTRESLAFCREIVRALRVDGKSNATDLQELFNCALTKHRRILSDTKLGKTLANIAPLLEQAIQNLPDSPQKAANIKLLRYNCSFDASLTGSPFAPHIAAMESALRRDNFIAGCYVGHQEKIVVSLNASGYYMDRIDDVRKDMERFIGIIIDQARKTTESTQLS